MNTYRTIVNKNEYIISIEEMSEADIQKNSNNNNLDSKKYCWNCGCEINNNAVICVRCGCPSTQLNQMNEIDDSVNAGLVILAVLIPLFGWIYWADQAKARPKCAKTCGISATISWIARILITAIIYGLLL